MMELELSARTDCGRVRDRNEDVARVVPHLALALVADGMGGHDNGEVASGLVVATVAEYYEQMGAAGGSIAEMQENVLASIRVANSRLSQRRALEASDMGTTLVVAAFGHAHVAVAHVGDSRLYRLRRGSLELLTDDHSLAAKLRGEGYSEREALRWEHILTRSLNGDERSAVDLRVERVELDDIYLLCSDGLWGAVADRRIARILERAESVEDACTRLVRTALVSGGEDNIAVAVVRCAPLFRKLDPRPGAAARAGGFDDAPDIPAARGVSRS